MGRRFSRASIDELENQVEGNGGNVDLLRQVLDELTYRTTKRARELRSRVEREIKAAPAPEQRADPSLELERALKIKHAPSHFTSTVPPAPLPPPRAPSGTPNALALLDSWTGLEVLSPQSFNRPEDLSGEAAPVVRFVEQKLPWEGGRHGRHGKRTYFQVSLGELNLGESYEAILKRYSDDGPDRAPSRSSALLGVVVCDSKGVPQTNRIAVSSFGWALHPALAGNLAQLGKWRVEEAKLQAALAERLRRTGPDGQPLPLDHPALLAVHSWLVRELSLKPEWVRPPSFAICAYEYLFVHEPPEPLILNSFFLADLARAHQLVASGQAPLALRRYVGAVAVESRRDVLGDPSVLPELLAPARTPSARWPSHSRSPLVTLQQCAVNAALGSPAGSVIAVNGPPGTGKTTLLRDIVAAVVSSRAGVMMQFDDPRTAFVKSGLTFTSSGAKVEVRSVNAQLRGFELVVASSNNGAVENVSRELPLREAVALTEPTPRYFASIATAVGGDDCWGLVAAVLGNSSNRFAFQQRFWKDEDRGMESYLATAAGTPRQVKDPATQQLRAPLVVTRENPPGGPTEALVRWKKARLRFQAALAASRATADQLQRVHDLEAAAQAHQERIDEAAALLPQLEHARVVASQALEQAAAIRDPELERWNQANELQARHQAGRPNFFSRFFRTEAARDWAQRDDEARAQAELARKAMQSIEVAWQQCCEGLKDALSAEEELLSMRERETAALAEANRQLAVIDRQVKQPG